MKDIDYWVDSLQFALGLEEISLPTAIVKRMANSLAISSARLIMDPTSGKVCRLPSQHSVYDCGSYAGHGK